MKYLKMFLLPSLMMMASGIALAQQAAPAPANANGGTVRAVNPSPEDKPNLISSLYFNGAKMNDVAKMFTGILGVPVVVSQQAQAKQITVFLENVRAEAALESLCRSYGLWYKLDQELNVIFIQTVEELKGSIQLMGTDNVEIVQVSYPNVTDIGEALKHLYVNKVVWKRPDITSGDRYDDIQSALDRMHLIGDEALLGSFEGTGSRNNNSSNRNNSGSNRNRNNSRFNNYDQYDNRDALTAAQETANELKKLTRDRLDAVLKQLGERAAVSFADVSVNPGVVYVAALPETNSIMLRSADPNAIKQMMKVIADLDKPKSQVLLEVKILSVRLDDTNQHALDFLFASGDFSGSFANGIPSTTTTSGNTILAPGANLAPRGTGLDNRAATFSAISDHFALRLQFLATDDRMTRLATPNLLVCDREASTIFVGDEVTVMEKAEQYSNVVSNSSSATTGTGWEITAPRRQIGTSLLITPQIHADRSVTIRVMQEYSQLGAMRQNIFQASSSDSDINNQYFLSQDITRQNLTTSIITRDQNLVVIGGLITESVEKTREKVPWFSEIPYLGELIFTRMHESRSRNEIIVVVRPFVLLAPGETDPVSRTFLQRISQHPSATKDIPSLGVNYVNEVAKPRALNPSDPWLIRAYDTIRPWSVDDHTHPNIEEAARKYNADNMERDAEETINRIDAIEENKVYENQTPAQSE